MSRPPVSQPEVLIGKQRLILKQTENCPPGRCRAGDFLPEGASSPYLLTLAPAPPMMASTSLRDAMEVSPGVVMASAPWAAP